MLKLPITLTIRFRVPTWMNVPGPGIRFWQRWKSFGVQTRGDDAEGEVIFPGWLLPAAVLIVWVVVRVAAVLFS